MALYNETAEHLVQRMCASEEKAYEEFSDIFEPKIKGYLVRHGLTLADAEDLTVSCITDIALKVDRYKKMEGTGLFAWVFTLVRHALVDWLRKREETSSYIDDVEIRDLTGEEPEPNLEVIASVREAVAKLSEREQAILELRYSGTKHSFTEIGDLLQIRPATVRVQHHRAINRLKPLLREDARISRRLKRAGIGD